MNMDRRTFTKLSVATAAAASLPVAAATVPEPQLVFFDGRYGDCRRFAAAFGMCERFDTAHDVAHLWYSQLRDRARRETLRIAGLTTHSDLFILERCAAEAKLELRFETFHDCRGTSTITHSLGKGCGRSAAHALRLAGTEWPTALAQVIAANLDHDSFAPLRLTTTAARAADHPGTLVSWLIA